jgi:dihydrofolate synthase/folylpolyglutamate synthase
VKLDEALQGLYARIPRGMRLGLEPMREACEGTRHPERAFEAVHVAGTNGKGSVCAMVESIARAAGRRTGLYTSPHLCRFAERIRIDGEPLADDALADLLARALAAGPELSFFETATLAAFIAFAEAKVDVGVLEVGIGGRLDATNVIPSPRAGAITRIALDHTDRLGGTLVEIAREKAGIAKPGVPIVLGPLSPEVRAAIDEVAAAAGATTLSAADDPAAQAFVQSASIGLAGAHQRDNAAMAYVLGGQLGASLEARAYGIAGVRWPGRMERVDAYDGPYLLDGAHNPDGAAALARHVSATRAAFDGVALVFGALADKAWAEMLDILAPLTVHRVYVAPSVGGPGGGPRSATPPEELAARHPGEIAASVTQASVAARRLVGPGGLVVVCGSIYLIGEARAALLGLPRDPPVAL